MIKEFICEGCHQPFPWKEHVERTHTFGPYNKTVYLCDCCKDIIMCSNNLNGIHGEVVTFDDLDEEQYPRRIVDALAQHFWDFYEEPRLRGQLGVCRECLVPFIWRTDTNITGWANFAFFNIHTVETVIGIPLLTGINDRVS